MSVKQHSTPVVAARLCVSLGEAAEVLGVSKDFFVEHVLPEIRIVRRGRRRLVPLAQLELWIDGASARTLEAA